MYDDLPTVFFQIHPLPISSRPGRVRRRRGVTLVWLHPGTLKAHAAFWAREHLTEQERVAVRVCYQQPTDLTVPIEDYLMDGEITKATIPVRLRVPRDRLALTG